PGASYDDLDQGIITEYIAKREERTRRKVTVGIPQLLREIGALDNLGHPTVAGILLFGRNPQAFMPQSGLVFVKFPGVDPRAEGGAFGYGRREEIIGPLARVIEMSWRVVLEEMRVGAVVTGLERQDVLEYPEFAVREALVNAVSHRDYRTRGRRIEIRKFSDRMEIISPGGLAGYITLDNIIEEHFSRNPRIVQGLFQWGYIEELGLGIDRMIEDMTSYGHPQPKFSATNHSFTVSLSNHRERRGHTSVSQPIVTNDGLTLNERQARALQHIHDHSRITNRDYQLLCPDVTAETLRTDLVDLVEKGVLMRIGEKKGTYYILK
ncbi:MAG TPA: ATP-binding protein, partial [Anaerolineae bacterium]